MRRRRRGSARRPRRDDVAGASDVLGTTSKPSGRRCAAGRLPRTGARRLLLQGTQAGGLRLAAALGDGLGQGAEEHRQPEPDRDDRRPSCWGRGPPSRWWPRRRSRRRASPGADQLARVELAERAGGARGAAREGAPCRRGVVISSRQGLHDRTEDEHRHVGQTDHDQGDAREEGHEERPVGGQGAGARRQLALGGERPARARTRTSAGTGRAACTARAACSRTACPR